MDNKLTETGSSNMRVSTVPILVKPYLTIEEAAEYTGIGRNNLRKLITWQKIPVIRIGNKILIRSEVLDQFLKKNEGHNLKNKYEVIAV